jgi:hypothetical protein
MALKTLALRSPGETGEDALHPMLSDGSNPELIAPDRYDGGTIQTLMAHTVTVGEVGGESVRVVQRVRNTKIYVYVSDGRIVVACPKWATGMPADVRVISPVYLVVMLFSKLRAARRTKNKVMVGQIRYPWVAAVGASVKGPRTPAAIRIRFVERYPSMELHKVLTVTFKGAVDTPLIAQDIVRRVASFRLAHYADMKDEERDAFARLQQDPPRVAPEPKKFAFVNMPTYYKVHLQTAFPDRTPTT